MSQSIAGTAPLYLIIAGFVSVVVGIFVSLMALDWFFKDGDDSTRSLQEFESEMNRPYRSSIPTKFGLWLLVSGGVGYVCFMIFLKAWRYFHHV
jgi:hypothetical protein